MTRGRHMHRFATLVEQHAEELALLECRNVGMPISDARGQLGMIIDVIRYYAGAVDKFFGHTVPVERDGVALTFREPIGVVGPDHALELPAEHRQLEDRPGARRGQHGRAQAGVADAALGAALRRAGRRGRHPRGRAERRPRAGRHRRARRSSSTRTSARSASRARPRSGAGIARQAAATIKRVTLELGGKSACVVFADADLEKVGRMAPYAVFENCGQDCCARSRLIVEESVKDELLERYAATASGLRVGMPEDAATEIGPLISAGQRETVEGYVRSGVDEGAKVVAGGERPGGELEAGFFYRPTVLDGVTQRHARRPRGDLRPGRQRHHVPRRGGGGADRKRHAVRPLGVDLDARRRPPAAGRAGDAHGCARRQLQLERVPADAVRRATSSPASARSSGCTRSSTTPS